MLTGTTNISINANTHVTPGWNQSQPLASLSHAAYFSISWS
jgi:hypothetical protein